MKTAIITSDSSINHLTGIGHPEQPDRVTSVINKLKQNENLIWKKSKEFETEFWSGRSLKDISSSVAALDESPIKYVFEEAVEEIEKSNKSSEKKIDTLIDRINRKIDAAIDFQNEKMFGGQRPFCHREIFIAKSPKSLLH